MLYDKKTSVAGSDVLQKARDFFSDRSPHYGAFVELEGRDYMTLRGRGGEEISIAVREVDGATNVRASSPAYGQAVARFLATLPSI